MSEQPTTPSSGRKHATRKSGRIHVCAFRAIEEIVRQHNASRLLTCLNDDFLVETPKLIKPDGHLRLAMHDIAEPLAEHVAPNEDHVAQIIDFALTWGGDGPMVVHCWAGISRSTAAAFTALCAINPGASEEAIAAAMREASPTAYPNRLIVRLADAALGRKGRMVRAIEAIGRGVVAMEAVPFSLAADHSTPEP
jgi:predicted protein tyrosine phosphatase